jgi:glycosyltransferase involved in cell wall biosynthesis
MFSMHIDTARTWRGGQYQVLLTVQGLRALGHRAVLVAHPDGELFRRMSEGHDLIGLAPRNEVDLAAAWRLWRVIRQLRPEVVHAHDPHAVAVAALALSFGTPSPRPLFVAARRVDFNLQGNSFSRWKYRQLDGFIAASDTIRRMLVDDGTEETRVVTVHEGIDLDRVLSAPPINIHAEFWLPKQAPIVGNVAALVPHKGQRYLVDAAAAVLRDVPDARFIILGDGELRPQLQHQIHERRLDKHVILAGFRHDVMSFHRSFDLFVLSSVTEGLGTSLLDAMAASKAIVATTAGGIPEVVADGDTGLLVPPRDSAALAEAIVRLLKNGDLSREMGRRAFERVQSQFSAGRMVDETLAAYATAWPIDHAGRSAPSEGTARHLAGG